jgi:hypothetical protein
MLLTAESILFLDFKKPHCLLSRQLLYCLKLSLQLRAFIRRKLLKQWKEDTVQFRKHELLNCRPAERKNLACAVITNVVLVEKDFHDILHFVFNLPNQLLWMLTFLSPSIFFAYVSNER